MKRRNFLRSIPVIVGGMTMKAYATSPFLSPAMASALSNDRILIIVQLSGGNDGLNTVIPIDQYSALSGLRSNVLIPQTSLTPLPGTNGATALHPSMTGMHNMWNEGHLHVLQGIGYPSFNYSHFRATDIMVTGADSNQVLYSGWTGRYLNHEFPNFPAGFPNEVMPDPLAIRIGGDVGLGLQHVGVNMGIAINNTNDPLDLTDSVYLDPPTPDCKGGELDFVREIQRQTDKYGDVVENAALSGCSTSNMYPQSGTPGYSLGRALKIIAGLISGGLKTRIYWVSTGGFDTHSNQVTTSNHALGRHADLLQGVSDAIAAFWDDVKLMKMEDRVLGMTFSEFGRRILSNASGGTDHGAGQPMFLFGNVIPGMTGTNPVIDPNSTVSTNIPMQHDFRSVYTSILKDWFCVPDGDLPAIMLNTYQYLPLVDGSNCAPPISKSAARKAGNKVLWASSTEFAASTTLNYETIGGHTLVQVFDEQGNLIQTLKDDYTNPGTYQVSCDLSAEPDGLYYCRFQNERVQQVKTVHKQSE